MTAAKRICSYLLAEDNPVNQKVAMALLTRRGHSVVVVGNGRLAVERSNAEMFDLVLMDLQMPEMDGWAASRAIRERERPNGVYLPIIALNCACNERRSRPVSGGRDGFRNRKAVRPGETLRRY